VADRLEATRVKAFVAEHCLISGKPHQESIECALDQSHTRREFYWNGFFAQNPPMRAFVSGA
jgi:hypothetical protein